MASVSISAAQSSPPARMEHRQFIQLFLLIFMLTLPVWAYSLLNNRNNFDILMASGFLHGNLYPDGVTASMPDVIPYGSHIYLEFGPFPAVLEMPFVALFGTDFNSIWIQVAVILITTALIWSLLTLLDVVGTARLWLAALFLLGALYFPSAAIVYSVWNITELFGVAFTIGAIILAERRQWFWAGLLLGFGVANRFSLIVNAVYFVLLIIINSRRGQPQPQRSLALFGLGLSGPLALILWYNYARFGNPLETGYSLSLSGTAEEYQLRKQYGLFSLRYIPTNFYYMFLASVDVYPSGAAPQFPWVQPVHSGMGIFFTTPAFVYLFRAPLRDARVLAALPTIALGVLSLLAYYHVGGSDATPQYGYHYLLDIMPFLFIVLIAALKRIQGLTANQPLEQLPVLFKWLTLISIALGIWGMLWFSDAYHYFGNLILQRLGLA